MSSPTVRDSLRTAASTIERLRAELDAHRSRASEPIAVVGLGVRMPGGADSPEEFWRVLRDGVDTTREFPAERGDATAVSDPDPDAPGRAYVTRGGFLDEVDRFDAAVFGISPREALGMDPQQRLALELAWEALERAGYAPDGLSDSRTGVYLGVSTSDYVRLRQALGDPADVDHYQLLGEPSFIAGRISFALGLQGPSSVVDTTCSSSLVAMHQACSALRAEECDLALAGGVNLMLSPYGFVLMSKFRALAPDGRCKTFDESADGYARGEGGAVLVLKRLRDALDADDRIEGVILGSAVNHDGHSSGMTVPNPAAQQRVIRDALADAGIPATEVDYLEAHGTGTSLGDPIELRAADAVYGPERRPDAPLLVGSVKTNVGHLEPAAGVAGTLKALLAMRHGHVPPHLHLTQASSQVPWRELRLTVPTGGRAWPATERPRRAAVSAFGASGTNAHTVLGQAPPRPQRPAPAPRTETILLSARTPEAVRTLAGAYARQLEEERPERLDDVAFTTQVGRARLAETAAVVARDVDEAIERLRAVERGEAVPGVLTGPRTGPRLQRTAWLFTGQGAQFPGMADGLRGLPAFDRALDACAAAFDGLLPRPLLELLADRGDAIHDTAAAQPALFAVEYALAQTLTALGARRPAALVGHSIGEFVAACVGGALDLPDAARLVAARGRLMSALPAGGTMLAAACDERAAVDALRGVDGVSLAAVNGPREVVLSGPRAGVDAAGAALDRAGVRTTPLNTSHAFHSSLLDPMLDELRSVGEQIETRAPQIPIVSDLTGDWWDERCRHPHYWAEHARGTVRFHDALTRLHDEGVRTFVELGPHAVLAPMGQRGIDDPDVAWIGTLRRGTDDHRALGEALARLESRGSRLAWPVLHEGRGARRVELPVYPWERERHWFTPARGGRLRGATVPGLGERLPTADPVFAAEHDAPPAAADLLPLLVERGWRAAVAAGSDPVAVGPTSVGSPLGDGAAGPWTTHVTVRPDPDGVQVDLAGAGPAQQAAGDAWHRHGAVALRDFGAPQTTPPDVPDDARRVALPDGWAGDPSDTGDAGGAADPADPSCAADTGTQDDAAASWAALLRAVVRAAEPADAEPAVAVGLTALRCVATRSVVAVAVQDRDAAPGERRSDVWLLDARGRTVGHVEGLRRRVGACRADAPWYPDSTLLLAPAWRSHDTLVPAPDGVRVALLDGEGPAAEAVVAALEARDIPVARCAEPEDAASAGATHVLLAAAADLPPAASLGPDDLHRLLALELRAVDVARRLAAIDGAPRLVLLTRGAAATVGQRAHHPAAATFQGLGRVLALETPDVWAGLIDLDPDEDHARGLVDALLTLDPEDEQAVRDGARLVERMVPRDGDTLPAAPARHHRPGTVLVTGGVGGIGGGLARWLARSGTERLVLTARTPLPPEEEWAALAADDPRRARVAAVREARAAGADVRVVAVDVTDAAATRALVAELAADDELPLRGVVHAAGVSLPQFVADVEPDDYADVWRPKVLGGWALHEATRDLDLDLFVCFSSVAATWGSQHLASYAAANAFLDGLARARRAEGLPALSVAWGPWDLPSNLFGDDVVAFLESVGLRQLAAPQCLDLLGRLVADDPTEQAVCAADWSAYRPIMELRRPRPRLSEIALGDGDDDGQGDAAVAAALQAARASDDPDAVPAVLRDVFRGAVADVLRVGTTAVDPDGDVFALGLDSLMIMEIVTQVRTALGVGLQPSALFERDTVRAWAAYLAAELGDGDATGDDDRDRWESAAALGAAVSLADDVRAATGPPAPPGVLRRVLLTGATGFVGAYLLGELLDRGAERVTCLVRCTSPEDGLRRIVENAAPLRPLSAEEQERVRVLPGDLAAPGLGLADGVLADEAADLDALLHNGAWVNFAHTFGQLRPANVDGTEELLRLGAAHGIPVHHVSTYGVWGLPVEGGRDVVLEEDDIDEAGRLVTGYVQSKWAAERLVDEAAARGVAVATYRLGRVVGDSRTGVALTSHFTSRVIKGCIQLGAAPAIDVELEMTPVDYVARALVRLAAEQPADGRTYHLVNDRHMPFGELLEHLARRGWELDVLPPEEWWARLQAALADGEPNDLHPVMDTVGELVVGGERAISYDATAVRRALDGTGIACPPLDATLLDAHLDFFLRAGYLPAPSPVNTKEPA